MSIEPILPGSRAEPVESTIPTQREYDVIKLVNKGLKNLEIATELTITENMVKNYLRNIYDKLGMWNRVELALWYEARCYEGNLPKVL